MNSVVTFLAILTVGAATSSSENVLRAVAKMSGASKVGEWVTYRIDAGPGRGAFWRMAAVEEAKGSQGEDLLWLEVELGTNPNFVAPMAQLRMLVPRILDLEQQDIRRLLVGIAGERLEELEDSALHGGLSSTSEHEKRGLPRRAVRLDKQGAPATMQTQAGQVKASPYRIIYGDRVVQIYWLSTEVPLLHLAKIEIPGLEQSFVVHDFGTDARPKVQLAPVDRPKIQLEGSKGDPEP